jgi:hypothetical protein
LIPSFQGELEPIFILLSVIPARAGIHFDLACRCQADGKSDGLKAKAKSKSQKQKPKSLDPRFRGDDALAEPCAERTGQCVT